MKNLTVAGAISGTQTYMGGIAAYSSADKSTIENCVNKAAITSTSSSVGGILGGTANREAGAIITGCTNEGTIIGRQATGGIVGVIGDRMGTATQSVTKCINKGSVTTTSGSNVGGIVGNISCAGTISQCGNTGNITSAGTAAGGIVGNASNTGITLEQCYNTDAVQGTYGVGGVAGSATCPVSFCYSTGSVTGTASSTSSGVGGVVGSLSGSSASLANCYNAGTVTGEGDNVAGLAGWTNNASIKLTDSGYLSSLEAAAKGSAVVEDTVMSLDADELKDAVKLLNGAGRSYVPDNAGEAALNNGYPILRWQRGADSVKLTSIRVTTPPTKTTYQAGEKFDAAGMVVTAYYDDDTSETVTDYTWTPSGALSAGETGGTVAITVSYKGMTATTDVTVGAEPAKDTDGLYLLDSQDDWDWFLYQIGTLGNLTVGVRLAMDGIVVTQPLAATTAKTYAGTFDGNGRSIELNITTVEKYAALFSYLNGATIKNLTVTGVVKNPDGTDGDCLAGIAGRADNTLIKNCVNRADITVTTTSTWNGGGNAAGIVAKDNYNNKRTLVQDCVNYGTISAQLSTAGGIVATFNQVTNEISGCANYGTVTAGEGYCGGIFGAGYCSVFDCVNEGSVSGTGVNGGQVGGVAARLAGQGSLYNCTNSGTVSGADNVGGIVGYTAHTTTYYNCANSGTVTGISYDVGGCIGYLTETATAYGLANTGKVTGAVCVGGVVGRLHGAALRDSYNTGAVTATSETGLGIDRMTGAVGGVVGSVAAASSTITGVYNTGKVTGTEATKAGALVGNYSAAGLTDGALVNAYYLTGAAAAAVGGTVAEGIAVTGGAAMSATELKDAAASLGENYAKAPANVNGGYPILAWQKALLPAQAEEPTISAQPESASYSVGADAAALTVTAAAADEGTLSYQWYKNTAESTEGATLIENATEASYTPDVTAAGVTYYFCAVTNTLGTSTATVNSAIAAITVTETPAPPVTSTWDGTVDVSWYNTTDTVFTITTPAQWAGAAAIVDGLTKDQLTAAGYTAAEEIPAQDSFAGKTLQLAADLDMGGQNDGTTWTGVRYLPLGGVYYLNDDRAQKKVSSVGFGGTVKGQGHRVYNVFADYSVNSGSSLGLIGWATGDVVVTGVWVDGYINAGTGSKAAGGIIGFGRDATSVAIENCVNSATIIATGYANSNGSAGAGGIMGVGFGKAKSIRNCANYGSVTGQDITGGILGAGGEGETIANCYNAVAPKNKSNVEQAGIANLRSGSNTDNYSGNYYDGTYGVKVSAADITSTDIGCTAVGALEGDSLAAALNGGVTRAWVNDADLGVCPRVFSSVEDTATVTGITVSVKPALAWVEGQTFTAAGMVVTADYSDGTKDMLKDYTLSGVTEGQVLTRADVGEKTVTVTYGTMSDSFAITVAARALVEGGSLTVEWNDRLFLEGRKLDLSGLKLTAKYTDAPNAAVAVDGAYTATLDGAAVADGDTVAIGWNGKTLHIAYTYRGVTLEGDTGALTVLSAEGAPAQDEDGYYLVGTDEELTWMTNFINENGAVGAKIKLTADVNAAAVISNSSSKAFTGELLGQGHKVTLNVTGVNNVALFGYVDGATLKDVVTEGTVTLSNRYGAGLAAYVTGETTIEGCINRASVSGTEDGGYYLGGIAGALYGTVENCYNTGAITAVAGGSLEDAGGIVGYIFPSTTVASGLKNCYNIGAVTAAEDKVAGELIGAARVNTAASTVENCYYLTGKNAAYTVMSGSLTVTDLKGVSDAGMKLAAAGLGSAYRDDPASAPINSGYPVLKWQVDETGGIDVPVINLTGTAPAAQVTAPAGGWQTGENTFTVSAPVACTVAVSHDGGATYTVLPAAANADGSYSFTADLTAASSITVVVKGDADNDGTLSMADAMAAMNAWGSGQGLSGTAGLAAKVSGGDLSMADAMAIMNAWGNGGFAW